MTRLRDDEPLYVPREVAAMFGVTTATIALWVRTGRMTASARTPGGHRRFRKADLQAFQPPRQGATRAPSADGGGR